MDGFAGGIKGFFRALPFLLGHRLAWLFLVPILFWALFSVAMFHAGGWLVDLLQGKAAHYLELPVPDAARAGWRGWWDLAKAFINSTRDVLLMLVVRLAVLWMVGLVGKYLVLALLSPVLSYVSGRAEELLTGRAVSFRWGRWLKEMVRGAGMAVRNGLLEGAITVILWIATLFLPVLIPFTALLLWLVSSWFYGFSMFDYVYERQGLGIRGSIRAARADRPTVLANGMAFNLLMKIPVLGVLTAPLLGAVGAVLASNPAPTGTRPLPRA